MRSRAVSARETRRLLATNPAEDHDLSTPGVRVYVFPDGRALVTSVMPNAPGRLYASVDDLRAVKSDVVRLRTAGNPFRELLPQGVKFTAEVPVLAGRLPALLGLEQAVLDLSVTSLAAVDRVVRRRGHARVLTPEIFPSLVAYVGEAIRTNSACHWQMRQAADGTTWEPWLVGANGQECPLLEIYKEIYEHGRQASLEAYALHYVRVLGQRGKR